MKSHFTCFFFYIFLNAATGKFKITYHISMGSLLSMLMLPGTVLESGQPGPEVHLSLLKGPSGTFSSPLFSNYCFNNTNFHEHARLLLLTPTASSPLKPPPSSLLHRFENTFYISSHPFLRAFSLPLPSLAHLCHFIRS